MSPGELTGVDGFAGVDGFTDGGVAVPVPGVVCELVTEIPGPEDVAEPAEVPGPVDDEPQPASRANPTPTPNTRAVTDAIADSSRNLIATTAIRCVHLLLRRTGPTLRWSRYFSSALNAAPFGVPRPVAVSQPFPETRLCGFASLPMTVL